MIKLNKPSPPYIDGYLSIVDRKKSPRKEILENAINIVIDRYDLYDYRFSENQLELFDPLQFDHSVAEALLHCYEGKQKELEKIKIIIKESQVSVYKIVCAYCSIDSASSFDHYLPQSDYPEFSVMPLNLIPSCSVCNSFKGDDWKDSTSRIFINYYLDDFLSYRFIKMEINKSNVGLYTVQAVPHRPVGMSISDYNIVESHFGNLRLGERFRRQGSVELGTAISTIKNVKDVIGIKSKVILKNLLRQQQHSSELEFGINSFKGNFYKALSESSDFIDDMI